MSDMPHAADQPGHDGVGPSDHHAPDDHGAGHGHDDHAHVEDDELGPYDLSAWGAGILGVILGLVVAACFVLATAVITTG